jgi:hypothetical protein
MKPYSWAGVPLRSVHKYLAYRLEFPAESYWDCLVKAIALSWDEWRSPNQAMNCATGYDGARAWAQAIRHGRSTLRLGFLYPADKERLQFILAGREEEYWTRQFNVMPRDVFTRWVPASEQNRPEKGSGC